MNSKAFAITLIATATFTAAATAQDTKVAIGISGWTGFAPLTLAKEAGLFKKYGLDGGERLHRTAGALTG